MAQNRPKWNEQGSEPGAEESARTGPGGAKRRCLILLGKNQPLPGELLAGLERRGIRVRVVGSRTAVIAELALTEVGAVIIAEPETIRGVEELVEVVRRWYPGVGLWVYRRADGAERKAGRLEKLAGTREKETVEAKHQKRSPAPIGWSVKTAQELGEPELEWEGPEVRNLLTEEELQMLLGVPEPERLDGRRNGG